MTGFLPPPPRAAVEAVLADLVTRGLLSARAAAGAGDPAGLPPLGELGVAGSLPAFVSSFGPRNLTVLNQLYGATLGDLAAEVVRAVVAAVAADAGPGTRAVRAHGPDVLSCTESRRERTSRRSPGAAATSSPAWPCRPAPASCT